MIELILGGTRSGKSEIGERRALLHDGEILYVATGTASDAAMAERIRAHQQRRGTRFRTVDAGADLVAALRREPLEQPALIDSLGTWVSAHTDFVTDTEGLCSALRDRHAATVIVSDEVGLGVHPSTDVGVRFRDALGIVNRSVADVADRVFLAVAGRLLPLPRAEDA